MPLPTPPGYRRGRQRRGDRRSILLTAVLAVVAGAAACAAWAETMRQLALTRLGEPGGPEDL